MSFVPFPAASPAVEYPRSVPHPLSLGRTAFRAVPYAALSALVFLVHGYHPYSQDAAIYVAGIEKDIHPSLFRVDAAFVDGQAKFSIFSRLMSLPVRYLSIPLELLLLIAYFASIAFFVFACQRLATRLFRSPMEQWGAVLLASACFTLPVAGTSLLLMDPYVTARSFSTPLSILAVVSCLDRSWRSVLLYTTLATLLHPLMGIYLAGFLVTLWLVQTHKESVAVRVCVAAFLLCGLIAAISRYVPITPAYREVVKTHGYFFLSEWHWYEIAGLIFPVILMGIAAERCGLRTVAGKVCATSMLVGITSYMSALCFVHAEHPDILARLQILRSFHVVYCVGVVLLGGFLIRYFRSRGIWVAFACFVIAFSGMFIADRQSYVESSHIEMPGETATNPWEQAFRWIRANTPQNAVFAADSATFTKQDEDVQGFRAIAQRSILNGAKDQSVASALPALAPIWLRDSKAEQNLDRISDQERIRRLRPHGVTWLLLSSRAKTSFFCPYRNAIVSICEMR